MRRGCDGTGRGGTSGVWELFFEKGFKGGVATSSLFSCFGFTAFWSLSCWNMISRPFPGTVFGDGVAKTIYFTGITL
jgi:hypothetical protein